MVPALETESAHVRLPVSDSLRPVVTVGGSSESIRPTLPIKRWGRLATEGRHSRKAQGHI